MGAPDEAEAQLLTAFYNWQWSSVFPAGYTGIKAPMLVSDSPFDIIDNILGEDGSGEMQQPIIAVMPAVNTDRIRTFGDQPFGNGTGTVAMGVDLGFIVSCWADERMGGGATVKKMIGQVQGCVLANRNSLTAFRHLLCRGGSELYEERPQMWRADLTVSGDGVNSA